MKKVKHSELKTLVKIAWKKHQPLYIWGGTGIGKSQMVKQACQEIAEENKLELSEEISDVNNEDKFILIDQRISQFDPSDLRGLPRATEDGTEWLINKWMPKKGKGILFFDELNLAPPSIQAAAYQLILDRRIGEYTLPDGYTIISAGNRLEDRANVFEMPAPLANRFAHIELGVPSIEAWSVWAGKNGIEPNIIGFLNFKRSLLCKFIANSQDKSFPTPRTWEFTSNLISGETNLDLIETLTASTVGEGVASEFVSFIKLSTKIDFKDILKNPTREKIPEDIGMKYAMISGIVELYRHETKLLPQAIKVTSVMDKAGNSAEYIILMLKLLKTANEKHWIGKIMGIKDWTRLAQRYSEYLLD